VGLEAEPKLGSTERPSRARASEAAQERRRISGRDSGALAARLPVFDGLPLDGETDGRRNHIGSAELETVDHRNVVSFQGRSSPVMAHLERVLGNRNHPEQA